MADASSGGVRGRLATAKWQLQRAWESLRGSKVNPDNYRPGEHGSLISFDGVPDYEEVDRYWVNAPWAFASINYDPEANEYMYYAVEPELDSFERELLRNLFSDIRDALIYRGQYDAENASAALREQIIELLQEYGVSIDTNAFHRLYYYLYREFEGFGKIDPLMNDSHIEDVSCDGYELPIFVYHDEYDDIETNISFVEEELDSFVIRLAQQSDRHISIGDPTAEVTLPDGSRGELALGKEVTPRGSAFTIRQYSDEPFTPVDLVDVGTFTLDQMAYLWLAIENNKSLIFAGGTASGKTTSMNAVTMFVPPRAKIITIEDTRELALSHDNWLSSVTREGISEGADVSMYDLLRSALRHRPEYLVVGEVRGEEAMTLFQAMNTGHTTYSTMHADSVQTVVNRLENEPINVPRAMIQSLDIICVQALTYVDESRVRRNRVIAEIEGIDQRTGDLDYSNAYRWDATTDTVEQQDSYVLEQIQEERGWSRSELLEEFRNRRAVLQYLLNQDVSDYRRFTALINEYYAHPDRVLERVDLETEEDLEIGL